MQLPHTLLAIGLFSGQLFWTCNGLFSHVKGSTVQTVHVLGGDYEKLLKGTIQNTSADPDWASDLSLESQGRGLGAIVHNVIEF